MLDLGCCYHFDNVIKSTKSQISKLVECQIWNVVIISITLSVYLCPKVITIMASIVQCKPLNVITLVQTESDNINRMITITDFMQSDFGLDQFDHINRMITLSVDYIKRLPLYFKFACLVKDCSFPFSKIFVTWLFSQIKLI